MTFKLRHRTLHHILPFPFRSREAAEAHHADLRASGCYEVVEVKERVISADEQEAREEAWAFEDRVQRERKSYHQ